MTRPTTMARDFFVNEVDRRHQLTPRERLVLAFVLRGWDVTPTELTRY